MVRIMVGTSLRGIGPCVSSLGLLSDYGVTWHGTGASGKGCGICVRGAAGPSKLLKGFSMFGRQLGQTQGGQGVLVVGVSMTKNDLERLLSRTLHLLLMSVNVRKGPRWKAHTSLWRVKWKYTLPGVPRDLCLRSRL
ncbi:hypothetical protein E2C01_082223 [Portunus trituberculatus]|uniref:Uncharacterized protein n=1 Tax=Portunus trituberculatus TaxID=210409 RepID=A0A5B7ITY6_PORTR|nr:hypothetical protein [Portunus trituberculatus]